MRPTRKIRAAAQPAKKRKRLSPDERRSHIVEEALQLFAEHGFEANTRILAKRIGVTQPLLFRYFSTKEDLIDATFELAYSRLAKRDWLSFIRQSEGDLRTRLINFFNAYTSVNYDFDWIRLYMFAGLAGGELNRRYIKRITEPMLRAIALEIRGSMNLSRHETAVTKSELDYIWIFHGGLYYNAIRHRIYGLPVDPASNGHITEMTVDAMLAGYGKVLKSGPGKRKAKHLAA
jgi:AcrR family transcriptional regulator